MIVVINSLGGLVSIQDEDLFQGSTKLNKIDLVAPFADNVIWKANFEMPDGTIRPDNLDGYLFQPSMKIVDNFNVWKLPITFPITQDYGIVTVQLRGYIGETVVCTTSIKLPIQKGVPYVSNFEELGDKDQLLQMISDLRALANTKADKVNYSFKPAENITEETVGIYFAYDDETEQYVSKTLPQEYIEGTQYYEVLGTGRIINIDGELSFEFVDNTTNQSMKLKIEKDKATLNEKQIVVFDDLKANNIDYDNSVSALKAENVQNAIDEVSGNVNNLDDNLNKKIDDVVNNVTKIGDEYNNFATKGATHSLDAGNSIAIGNGARTVGTGDIAIGSNAKAEVGSLALGSGANAFNGGSAFGTGSSANNQRALAFGYGAKANAHSSVQFGYGTNNEFGSFQFKNYNIVTTDGKLRTNAGTSSAPAMEIVATEKYVQELISKISGGGITLKVVDVLPTEDIDTNAIHLVPVEHQDGNNYYEEYLNINNVWELIGTTAIDLSNYVSLEDFDKLVNNEVQIKTTVNSFKAGNAKSATNYAIAIGQDAKAAGTSGVAIGRLSESYGGTGVGYGAKSKGYNSIQLGQGTNSTDNTLQIFGDNIYNFDTHTLTVQNIELNGENLAEKLENAGGSNITNVDSEITTAKFEGVVHLSEAQYQELITNGSITIGEQTLTYNENAIYVTPENSESGGGGGVSAKKYQHNICFKLNDMSIYFTLITDDSSPFTNILSIIETMRTQGYVDYYNNYLLATGGTGGTSPQATASIVTAVYVKSSTTNTDFGVSKFEFTASGITYGSTNYGSSRIKYITDKVVEL